MSKKYTAQPAEVVTGSALLKKNKIPYQPKSISVSTFAHIGYEWTQPRGSACSRVFLRCVRSHPNEL